MFGPKFQLYITTDRNVRLLRELENRIEAGPITIAYTLSDKIVTKYEDEAHLVLVLGHVIIGDAIRTSEVITHVRNRIAESRVAEYNGLWLLIYYEKATGRLHVINDRFASYPLYRQVNADALHLSMNYTDIHSAVGSQSRFDRFAAYEFLALRRLMGERTYEASIAYVRGATHLIYDTSARMLRSHEYWHPRFEKSTKSREQLESEVVKVLESPVRRRLTDGKRYGVLLSGGVDSRAVLMMADAPVTAFTNCDWKNNEYDVAREVACSVGTDHIFLQRPVDYFRIQEQVAQKFTCGMYSLSEAGWIIPQYAAPMYSRVDALFHGCGLDYLIGDNYTPHSTFGFGRIKLYSRKCRMPQEDLIDDFLRTISWRFKDFDFMEWFNPAARSRVADALRSSLFTVMSRGLQYTNDPTDLYLFLTIHNPSRHSMYFGPMMIRAYVDERCPGWDNDYFDLCLTLPHRYRQNWKLYRRALAKSYPKLMGIREANTNIPPRFSPMHVDASRMCHALMCLTGARRRRPFNSRSWPVMDKVATPPLHNDRVETLLMDRLPELSRDMIRRVLSSPFETIAKNLLRTLICFLEDEGFPTIAAV